MSETVQSFSHDEAHGEDIAVKKAVYSLKHFSPLIVVVEKNSPELLIPPFKTVVNAHFHEGKHKIPEKARNNIFSDYYLTNTNNHFVWTKRNVTKKDKKDTKIDAKPKKEFRKGEFKYDSCNLENPDESFELRVKGQFGFGLFAKHVIPKGLFSLTFFSYLY